MGVMLYLLCNSSMLAFPSSSFMFINLNPLFSTFCSFNFCVFVVAFMGMGGYSRMGTSSVLMRVVLTCGERFLNLYIAPNTAVPLFFLSVM